LPSGRDFYSKSKLKSRYTREDILQGKIIKLNPALVTLTDGLIGLMPPRLLQEEIMRQVEQILEHGKVYTFHVDLNYGDYKGFGHKRPEVNTSIFTPAFLQELDKLVRSYGCLLNLHLLTSQPYRQLLRFSHIDLGAVCFQLDAIPNRDKLVKLIRRILDLDACASPVIETIGSENLIPKPPEQVWEMLKPILPEIGMLTFQLAGTASRSNMPEGSLQIEPAKSYINHVKDAFTGTIQIQGGITVQTIREAIALGAEFLVCGTQLFHNPDKLTPIETIDLVLLEASKQLTGAN